MDDRKKLALKGFAVLLSFLFASMIYLLFFNAGLGFVGDNEDKRVFVVNNSFHSIKEIEIYLGDEKIDVIDMLKSKEQKEIELHGETGRILLTAKALFHIPVESVFYFPEVFPSVDYTPKIQENITTGSVIDASLNVCSKEKTTSNFEVSILVDKDYFESTEGKKVTELKAGECKDIIFKLKPLKQGVAVISFKFFSEENSLEIKKNVVIN